jgi:hypothetical protein
MTERVWLARYVAWGLAAAGGAEWLLGRTISRLTAAPPLEGPARTVVETLGWTGIALLSPSFVLGVALFLICLHEASTRARVVGQQRVAGVALVTYLFVYGVFTLAYSLLTILSRRPVETWLVVTFNLLSLIAIWWLAGWFSFRRSGSLAARLAVVLVALAYTGWTYYVVREAMPYLVFGSAGFGLRMRDAGELAAVLTPFALFAAIAVPGGQWRKLSRWWLPVSLAAIFAIGNVVDMLADQGFMGVFASWSLGLTLYLPWPLYATSLALFVYSILVCFSGQDGKAPFANRNVGLGLLLLLYAGYYLQLTYQHMLAILSLMLLTGIGQPLERTVADPEPDARRLDRAAGGAAEVGKAGGREAGGAVVARRR